MLLLAVPLPAQPAAAKRFSRPALTSVQTAILFAQQGAKVVCSDLDAANSQASMRCFACRFACTTCLGHTNVAARVQGAIMLSAAPERCLFSYS